MPEQKKTDGKGVKGGEIITMDMLRSTLCEMLEKKLDEKLAIVHKLAHDVERMCQRVREQERQVEGFDSYSRRNNLVLHGVPMKANEDPLELVTELGEAIGIPISPDNVDAAHRLPSKNEKLPPPFIIKFVNRWRKERVMEKIKVLKPTAEMMGGSKSIKVFCNDHLTPKNQQLLMEAKKLKDKFYVWSKNGNVLCKSKSDGARTIRITEPGDIEALTSSPEDRLKLLKDRHQSILSGSLGKATSNSSGQSTRAN